MAPPIVDYSLYLVTDTTPPILGTRELRDVVRAAVKGGVTIVQHRDKTADTASMISMSRSLHAITQKAGIPLLINDRVDVALAIGAEGVHLGQDDMPLATAREMLGNDKIIGITVNTKAEAEAAVRGGADYLGVGTMFSTATKKDTKGIIGTAGTQEILEAVAGWEREVGRRVQTVSIGGINLSNVQRVIYQSQAPSKGLDGVAVVSALIAAQDPQVAAGKFRELIASREEAPFATLVYPPEVQSEDLLEAYLGRDIPAVLKRVQETKPLCHNMTNLVVQNFAANVALAVGGSPIMANDGNEAPDLAALGGSLVINMGSATPHAIEQACLALAAYNAAGGPVLFDPVGGGATASRRAAAQKLLAAGYFDLIKGNESEILSVSATSGSTPQQKGVDSGDSDLSPSAKARIVRDLAARRRNIVLMTGKEDYLSDGSRVFVIKNGHPYLGRVTGTGCTLGSTIAAMLAVEKQDKLLAALTGLLVFELAAEKAAEIPSVAGPGTFVPHFIDALADIADRAKNGDESWLKPAKVEVLHLEVNGIKAH